MTRWIAFDPETTSLLRSNLSQGTRIDTLRRGPVDYALARAGAVITVLPAPENGGLGIAVFRAPRHLAAPAPAAVRPAAAVQPVATPPAQATRPSTITSSEPPAATARPTVTRTGTRASGFLGLSDELFEEEEAVEEKKSWWKKLWDE